uniref:Uncharacterized protein n=1 Tax=Botryococcus braunii TaxID=38881 RepID=A0A0U2F052_BOTBR|nr:hypothetical protein [Botryococcus braunii]AKU37110.1 hypothetical protein [Botryococcus braunii]
MLFTPNHSEQRLPPPYYRGCWHGVCRDYFSGSCHHLFPKEGVYDLKNLLPPWGMAGSGFRPLSKIPHCCRPKVSGPSLNPSVVDHPLRSTKDLGLGGLLLHQLPNPPRAHLSAVLPFTIQDSPGKEDSPGFPDLKGRFSCITHPFATRPSNLVL